MVRREFAVEKKVVSERHVSSCKVPRVEHLLLSTSGSPATTSEADATVLPERFGGPGFFFM